MAAKRGRPIVIFVMAGTETEAGHIAQALVTERLAACANIVGPVRSIYRWRGAIEEAREYWMVVKTRRELYSMVERKVRELHSYEVPEILALEPVAGSSAYLDWIVESTAGAAPRRRRVAPPL
jgi:periplasmic divalent cation tolerance protein